MQRTAPPRATDYSFRATDYRDLMLEPGTLAPDFSLPDHEQTIVNLADQRGSWVLMWWYPKAATPG